MSRIALGVHSWNQIFVGVLIAYTPICYVNKHRFYRFLARHLVFRKGSMKKLALTFLLASNAVTVIFYYVNKALGRFSRPGWREVPECPGYIDHMIQGQFDALAYTHLIPGLLYGAALNVEITQNAKKPIKVAKRLKARSAVLRVFFALLICLVEWILYSQYKTFRKYAKMRSIELLGVYNYLSYAGVSFFLAFGFSYFHPVCCKLSGALLEGDLIEPAILNDLRQFEEQERKVKRPNY